MNVDAPQHRPPPRPGPFRSVPGLLAVLFALLGPSPRAAEQGRVEVTGAEALLSAGTIDSAVAASGLRDLDCAAAAWAVRFRAGRLETALREQLRDARHFAPRVDRTITDTGTCWAVAMSLDPGPETRLRAIDVRVDGPGRSSVAPLLEDTPLVPGAPFDEGRYEGFKRALQDRLFAAGYLAARFTDHRVDVWPEDGAADVTLAIDTGPRHHFGPLRVRIDPDVLDADVIERLVDWHPGAPWSREAIAEVRRDLLASGYVDSVDLRSRPETDATVAVDARLALQRRYRIGGGLGFATDVGPRGELSFADRYRNRRGHQTGADLRASPVLSSLRGEYRLPLPGRARAWLLLEAGLAAERTDTVQSDAVTASARRVHTGPFGTRMTEFVELSRERFEVALDDETSRLVVVGSSVERTRRTALEPFELGWRVRASIRGAAAPLSTADFLQLRGEAEAAVRAGATARLIARVGTGATWTPSIAQLPSSLRFFAGGDRSIRGYGLDDVGPLAANGEVRGGRHLLVGSLEYERLVRGRWSVAAFADSGGAFNDADDPWVTGVGAGVRWRSPLGPVRFDLAVPLDDPSRELRLHVGIGTQFR